jgi:CRISPR-associated endonuclease/helicase Cas3
VNILLISQCDKRALTETRRILDQFAERRGDQVWQTPITQAGLDTLRKLLRKTARKNTAVACHWIRGLDHSELLWIVGDASRFNAQGAVPTDTTRRDILRREDENDWHTLEDIRLLAQMAALWHDMGKASEEFQERLRHPPQETSLYRHEWVSLRLFLAFVGKDDDADWLQRLATLAEDDKIWRQPGRFWRDGLDNDAPPPFQELPPLAAAIGWLIVSHHRLPVLPVREGTRQQWLGKRSPTFNHPGLLQNLLVAVEHDWNECRREAGAKETAAYWSFAHPLPVCLPRWRAQAAKLAQRLLALNEKPGKGDWLQNPYVMHLARLALMLADHHYSSLPPVSQKQEKETKQQDGEIKLFANTDGKGYGEPHLKQPLDEHLLGVARDVAAIVHGLPDFVRRLPHLARHRGLKQRSREARFRWQNKAADTAESLRAEATEHGAFIINMASTGCGKTLANARIMYALTDPQQGWRCTFALGLRTLTLQTGNAYRQDLHLRDDELAIRVGGSASRALFDYYQQQAEASGSASSQALIEEDGHVSYEGQIADHGLLDKAMHDPVCQSILSAPLLVCTIDHLTPATESQRGGRQIAPMLRLMSGDLVLDELDDFGLDDLPALTRLAHWTGLLGARLLISSATLPPALIEGLYLAYRAGRRHYRENRGADGERDTPEVSVPCLWVDEFNAQSLPCADAKTFGEAHAAFVETRVQALEKVEPRRRGELLPLNIACQQIHEIRREFAVQVREAMVRAHDKHHETCPHSGKQISFGLVRMANIEPLFDVALELFGRGALENHRIHLCVYHSRFPLLLRSAIEARLDAALNRRKPDAVYQLPEIRAAIDSAPEQNHLFVVLGSPVTEVGRDHDYDWAVVEPSSMRSLIQLAGRVQRHRQAPCPEGRPNIFVFEFNLRHFEKSGESAFTKPGFESDSDKFRLSEHSLTKLLRDEEYKAITARPRIQPRPKEELQGTCRLVDLEHVRLCDEMLPKMQNHQPPIRGKKPDTRLNAACAWQTPQAALTWILPQQQPFRDDTDIKEIDLVFLPDEDEQKLVLHYVYQKNSGQQKLYARVENGKFKCIELSIHGNSRIIPWGQNDLIALLREYAEAQDLTLRDCAKRFAMASVLENTNGWRWHPVLGFAKKKGCNSAAF